MVKRFLPVIIIILVLLGGIFYLWQTGLVGADSNQLVCSNENDRNGCHDKNVSIYTTKREFTQGEAVDIFLEVGKFSFRPFNGYVRIPNNAPWVVKNSSGDIVYQPEVISNRKVRVAGEETKKWTWNQQGVGGGVVGPGLYSIHFYSVYRTNGSKEVTESRLMGYIPISIDSSISASGGTYVKADNNSNVTFGILNVNATDLTYPTANPWVIKDLGGNVIYTPATAATATLIRPSEYKEWAWDGKKSDGVAVTDSMVKVVFVDNKEILIHIGAGTIVVPSPLSPAQADPSTLTVSKPTFTERESVSFTYTNNTSETKTFSTSNPWTIKDAAGTVVKNASTNTARINIAAGQTKSWTWNQRSSADERVAAGSYTVSLGTLTATFEIR